MKKRLFVFLSFLLIYIAAWAATFNTQSNGAWGTGGTWAGGSAPSDWGSHTANINHNVTVPSAISGFTAINLNGGRSFTSGSSGTPQNLTLTQITNFTVNNGNITVYGDLTLTNSTAMTITAGSLTVTGKLTLSGGSTLTFNSPGTISVGSYETSGSGGTLNLNNGSMAVTNAITLASASAINVAASRSLVAGSFTSSNSSTSVLNNSGSVTINGASSVGGPINNASSGTITMLGNVTMQSSSTAIITNSGQMDITGAVSIPGSAKFYTNPGGRSIVRGNVSLTGNENIVVGTGVNPPPNADMIITGNLASTSSGDVKINTNGRFGLFGNFSGSGGGTFFTVENQGQAYVHGTIKLDGGGGNGIVNNNTADPYGLYVNGSIDNASGSTDSNLGDLNTLRGSNIPFYNWLSLQPGSPFTLPIELLSFAANAAEEGILVEWSTSMEKDFSHFEVQHSKDGRTFTTVNITEGAGNSNTRKDYNFLFVLPSAGKNYFRLKSVDLDQTFKYSQVISFSWNQAVSVSVYPNPVTSGNFKIRVDEGSTIGQLQVVNQIGSVAFTLPVVEAGMDVQLPSSLEPGPYLVRMVVNGKAETIRIAVQ